jgi:hypothetical protein
MRAEPFYLANGYAVDINSAEPLFQSLQNVRPNNRHNTFKFHVLLLVDSLMEGRHALLPLRRPPCINYCLSLPCISNSVLCHLIVYLCHILGNRTSYCNPVFKALQVQRRRIGVGERDKCLRRLLRVVGLFSIDSDRCFTRSPRRCSICVDYFFRVFDGIAAVLLSAEVPWFHYRHMNSQWSDLDGQALVDAFYGKFRRAIAIWLQRNALTASWLERIEVVAEAREM